MLAERLNRLEGREKLGLLLVVLVLVVLVLDFAVIRPINTRCLWLDGDIERETKTLVYQESVLQAGPHVEAQFSVIHDRIGDALPAAEARREMRGAIDTLAQESDVTLISVKDREPRRTENFDEYAVDIADFETDEQGLARFLHALMGAPGTYRVTRMKIAPDSSGKRVKGSMTVTRVTLPAPTAEPVAAAPAQG
ncbi:MAG: hypothetical protein IT440_12560 [Phycisphaeraceae bacterium]|nr:hypothetical protein [Phycisphaeraceae bacterium]